MESPCRNIIPYTPVYISPTQTLKDLQTPDSQQGSGSLVEHLLIMYKVLDFIQMDVGWFSHHPTSILRHRFLSRF